VPVPLQAVLEPLAYQSPSCRAGVAVKLAVAKVAGVLGPSFGVTVPEHPWVFAHGVVTTRRCLPGL
jgi:hypothetical protein